MQDILAGLHIAFILHIAGADQMCVFKAIPLEESLVFGKYVGILGIVLVNPHPPLSPGAFGEIGDGAVLDQFVSCIGIGQMK